VEKQFPYIQPQDLANGVASPSDTENHILRLHSTPFVLPERKDKHYLDFGNQENEDHPESAQKFLRQ